MPRLDESKIIPRQIRPMRALPLKAGDRIAWFPQAYKEFETYYASDLQHPRLQARSRPRQIACPHRLNRASVACASQVQHRGHCA